MEEHLRKRLVLLPQDYKNGTYKDKLLSHHCTKSLSMWLMCVPDFRGKVLALKHIPEFLKVAFMFAKCICGGSLWILYLR